MIQTEMDLIWKHTHPQYRSVVNGVRYILMRRFPKSVFVPLEDLTSQERADELWWAKHHEDRGAKGYNGGGDA